MAESSFPVNASVVMPGLSITDQHAASLVAKQQSLRRRADRLRSGLRPDNEPGPLDLRWRASFAQRSAPDCEPTSTL